MEKICIQILHEKYAFMSIFLWKCRCPFSDGPAASPVWTRCFCSLFGWKWREQMMTVGCITPWDDFRRRMTRSDKATADRNICPLQMLHSLSETISTHFAVTCNWSTCCWSRSVILTLPRKVHKISVSKGLKCAVWWAKWGGRGRRTLACTPELNNILIVFSEHHQENRGVLFVCFCLV